MEKELSTEGCINLVGAIIAMAIRDYQSINRIVRKRNLNGVETKLLYETEQYLFEGGLEEQLDKFGLTGHINTEFIRDIAKERKSRFYLSHY